MSTRPPSAPAPSSSASRVAHALDEPGPQQPAERGGDRALVAGLHLERVGERAARRGRARCCRRACAGTGCRRRARRRREPPRGARPRARGRRRGARRAPSRRWPRRSRAARAARRPPRAAAATSSLGIHAGALERDELALELGLVVGGEPLELGLQRRDPLAARGLERAALRDVLGAGFERRELGFAALDALAQVVGERARALEAQLDALGRRARAVDAPRERLALLAAGGQRLVDLPGGARRPPRAAPRPRRARRGRRSRRPTPRRDRRAARGRRRARAPSAPRRSGARGARAARRPRPGA